MIAPAFGFIAWIFEKIRIDVLDKIIGLLSIYILLLGLYTFNKRRKEEKRNKKMNNSPRGRAERTVELAFDPEGQAKEIDNTISTYRKVVNKMIEKIKRFFRYVFSNKETLSSILCNLFVVGCLEYVIISDLLLAIPFFAEHYLIIAVTSGVIAFLYVLYSTHSIALSCGWENPEAFNKRILEKKAVKAQKLDKDTIKILKAQMNKKNKELKIVCKELNKANGELDTFGKLTKIGYSLSNEETNCLNNATTIKNNAESKKVLLETEIDGLKHQLKK